MSDFTTYSEKRDWIERTLLDLREGECRAGDLEKLRALLAADREARLIYLRSNQFDFLLTAYPDPQPARLRLTRSQVISGLFGAGIAAAIVMIAWLFTAGNSGDPGLPQKPALAQLMGGFQAVYENGEEVAPAELREGKIAIERGLVEIEFRNGASIVLEGRCAFEIVDPMTAVLHHGKLWAHCPPEAHGFRILAPGDLEIIDLGTEFGVEVSDNGETDLHIFDGLVEVNRKQDTAPSKFEAGEAMKWTAGATETTPGRADSGRFVSVGKLTGLRLEAYRKEMRERQDLVLFYDFSRLESQIVPNEAARPIPGSEGVITKAVSVQGRFEGSDALLFERRGDALALDLAWPQDGQKSFTMAMWVKVDRLKNILTTLINSDGWEPGDIHFQMTQKGALRAAINGGAEFETTSAVVRPGTWQLLAVTWDLESMTARFSCDGKAINTTRYNNSTPAATISPRFGACRIGSWEDGRAKKSRIDERYFKGRIDEVMVFDHALSDGELSLLHASGRP